LFCAPGRVATQRQEKKSEENDMPEINNMFGAIRNASLKFYLENVQGLEYLDMDVYY